MTDKPHYMARCGRCGETYGDHCCGTDFCPQEGRSPSQIEPGGFTESVYVPVEGCLSHEEKIEKLMATHYRIMTRKRYWYEPRWQEATKKLCVMASDLRKELRDGNA